MSVYIQTCSMEEVPHISERARKDFWESTPPYLRDARCKGIPLLGAGLIYPIPEEDIKVPARTIQLADDWPCGFAMDISFQRTAVAWFARNPVSKVIYFYDCHRQGREEPAIHVEAIKSRGAWIPGVIDPRADSRSVEDSKQLFNMYTQHYGLDIVKASASVETGIMKVWQMLVGGMLKVSDGLQMEPFWKEFRIYRRKSAKDGGDAGVLKKNDDLMDCLRYFVASGIGRMRTKALEGKGQSDLMTRLYGGWRGGAYGGSKLMGGFT